MRPHRPHVHLFRTRSSQHIRLDILWRIKVQHQVDISAPPDHGMKQILYKDDPPDDELRNGTSRLRSLSDKYVHSMYTASSTTLQR